MKKLTTIIATMASVLLTGACNKAEVEHEGSAVTLDYTVSLAEAATKAIGDGKTVNKLTYAIYDGDMKVSVATVAKNDDNSFTFAPSFYYGKTYTVVMFAYNDGAYAVDEFLCSIKKKTDVVGEAADAFTHKETITLNNDGTLTVEGQNKGAVTSHAVTLTRPVAQLVVATELYNEMEQAGASKIQVELSAPSTYNAVLSAPSTTSATANYTSTVAELGTIEVSGKTYAVVSCNYLLPTELPTVTVKILKADDTVIRTITLDNVPLVANKKTQIYGNLVKGELTFNVTVSADFDEWDPSDKGQVKIDK